MIWDALKTVRIFAPGYTLGYTGSLGLAFAWTSTYARKNLMETPRQVLVELGQLPNGATIAHEVGHTAIAFLQVAGVPGRKEECCIAFRHMGAGMGATSHNPIRYSRSHELVMRSLAGVAVQSIICPDTVEVGLCGKLLDGTLFVSVACFEPNSEEALAMDRNKARSDWDNIISVSREAWPDPTERLNQLRAAQIELVTLCAMPWFKAIINALIGDVAQWLDQEQVEVDYLVVYPESRVAGVFAQHPA